MTAPEIYLVDNGSLRPDATFELRDLAARLSGRTGHRVRAVSLLHSHKIDPAELDAEAACIVKPTLRKALAAGRRRILFLPLFLGPSRAITDYLPELIAEARKDAPDLEAVIADPLAGADVTDPDARLAGILAEQVLEVIAANGLERPKVALVDHGTPILPVNQLRNAVAGQLAARLADRVGGVIASSMERRKGEAYAFNEPLLERLGGREDFAGGTLVVALFFLLPGRHAGEGGDVAAICDGLLEAGAFERIEKTPLLCGHPALADILRDRLESALGRLDAGAGAAC